MRGDVFKMNGAGVSAVCVDDVDGVGGVEGLVAQVLVCHPHQDLPRPSYYHFFRQTIRNLKRIKQI